MALALGPRSHQGRGVLSSCPAECRRGDLGAKGDRGVGGPERSCLISSSYHALLNSGSGGTIRGRAYPSMRCLNWSRESI